MMHDTGDRMLQRIVELETQNRMLEAFAGAVAHNLKGLLYHIAGYASTLRDVHVVLSDAELRECLELMHGKAQETIEMMDDLLFLSGADPDVTAAGGRELGQVSEPALEGMLLAEAIRAVGPSSEPARFAAGPQEAVNGKDRASTFGI
jgi:signal transduction histidine kinase